MEIKFRNSEQMIVYSVRINNSQYFYFSSFFVWTLYIQYLNFFVFNLFIKTKHLLKLINGMNKCIIMLTKSDDISSTINLNSPGNNLFNYFNFFYVLNIFFVIFPYSCKCYSFTSSIWNDDYIIFFNFIYEISTFIYC